VSDPTDLGTPTSPLIAALLARTGGTPVLPANSRYQGLPTRTWTGPDGTPIVYLARRLVPQPSSFASLETYTMGSGERLDQVAAAKYGDPLLAWRLADANGALDPAELEHRGERIRIVLPEGVPGPGGA
jgi:hypothetical protein